MQAALFSLLLAVTPPSVVAARPQPVKPAVARQPGAVLPRLTALRIEPAEVSLVGPRAEQRLVVTGLFSDGVERPVTSMVQVGTPPPVLTASPRAGLLVPITDGKSRLTVRLGAVAASVPVTVTGSSTPRPISFDDEVQPVLTRAGCNQGACHGSQLGKGGFKLSLLGFDSDSDHQAIVRQYEGRRVDLVDPGESLLLRKATAAVPHAGGTRFKQSSYEYRTLRRWLADGATGPDPASPGIVRLDVLPARRSFRLAGRPAEGVQVAVPQVDGRVLTVRLPASEELVAMATYKDGRRADVTVRTQFNTQNDAVIAAGSGGEIEVSGRGATAVMVRYRGAATAAHFTVPYRLTPPPPQVASTNPLDRIIAGRWAEMGLLPSSPAADHEFIRRVYGDVLGILPTPTEVRAFLADTAADKRARMIDAVLARPEYVDYWTLKWGDLLRINRERLGDQGMWAFHNWVRAQFRDNRPFDKVARELITAQGSTFSVGPANFFREPSGPPSVAENTTQVLLGIRLACARCHHHPYEKWSQDDYWQMVAFFQRVGIKGSQEFGIFGQEQVVLIGAGGEAVNPRTGKVMKPTPLDGQPEDDPVDRRRALARWLGDPQNPFFARSVVNRYWGYLMGRGIVEPVDDMRVTNPPSNPELLDTLAKSFVEGGYDVKKLLRSILTTRAYALSGVPTAANKQDELFYSHYTVKRMGAEELLDAVLSATGGTEKFPNLPAGMRAVQIPDPGVQSYFLEVFGRPARVQACECERSPEPNMAQALHLINSEYVQQKITGGSGRVAQLIRDRKTDAEAIGELYLATFSREPTARERERAILILHDAPSRKEGLEDLLWALLNSREFIFKH